MPIKKLSRRAGAAPAQTRAEIIANYASLPAPAAPAAKPAAPAPDPVPAAPFEPTPYEVDADEVVVCPECGMRNDTDAAYCDQCGVKLAGRTDVEQSTPDATDPPLDDPDDTSLSAAGGPDNANPVDAAGNIDGAAVCANGDCGHTASSHLNDDKAGDNTGACGMPDCECLGFQVDSQPNSGNGGVTEPTADEQMAAGPVDGEPGAADAGGQELNAPPPLEMEDTEAMGAAFHTVIVIEGQPTGDGRQIAGGALTWRIPPIPLMLLDTETHDPEGWDLNDPAVICGRIESVTRMPGEGATQLIVGNGHFLNTEEGVYAAELVEQMGRMGVSADVATQATEITINEDEIPDDFDPMWDMPPMTTTITEGIVVGATVCPYPAFEGCYIMLGDGTAEPEVAPLPVSADGPAMPATPPPLVAAGGQLVHLMSYEDCGCDIAEVIVAAGAPTKPPADWFEDPRFEPADGRLVEVHGRGGRTAYACPITVTENGQVFGHLAPWNVCHTGQPGCVVAPHSRTDYAYFRRGQHMVCADGSSVRVGAITANAGHARLDAGGAGAMAHYDNSASITAFVNCGEDEYGIWVAGVLAPTCTDEQASILRGASLSGDWRQLGGGMELIAALAVPVPGFPIAQVERGTLVAAGARAMYQLKHPAPVSQPEEGDRQLRAALAPLLGRAAEDARQRLARSLG